MSSGVFLPFAAVSAFSPAFQQELSKYVLQQLDHGGLEEPVGAPELLDDDAQPADLSPAQAKKFLDRVSDKVRTTITLIAEADVGGFSTDEVVSALGEDEGVDLRGVWGGITKRTRTVLDDDTAHLIWWMKKGDIWIGRVSPTTRNSFRKILDL